MASLDLQQYAGIISLVLLFVDGLLFGVAIKKGVTSAILFIVAIALSAYVGLSIPYLSTAEIVTHFTNIVVSMYSHLGPILTGFPILFMVGLAIGLWKG